MSIVDGLLGEMTSTSAVGTVDSGAMFIAPGALPDASKRRASTTKTKKDDEDKKKKKVSKFIEQNKSLLSEALESDDFDFAAGIVMRVLREFPLSESSIIPDDAVSVPDGENAEEAYNDSETPSVDSIEPQSSGGGAFHDPALRAIFATKDKPVAPSGISQTPAAPVVTEEPVATGMGESLMNAPLPPPPSQSNQQINGQFKQSLHAIVGKQ